MPTPSGVRMLLEKSYSEDADPYKHFGWVYDTFGLSQRDQTIASNDAQIAYDEYLKQGNLRAYNDWQKNVGIKGRTIRYPELSFPGAIYRADTGIARSNYNSASAYSNYRGNFLYRAAGLYGITSRATRDL